MHKILGFYVEHFGRDYNDDQGYIVKEMHLP